MKDEHPGQRNCRKHFPQLLKPEEIAPVCWSAVYNSKKPAVEGTQLKECPRSLITPEMQNLVLEIFAARDVHEATGAFLYGQDSSEWDARFYDAVQIVHAEELKANKAN